MNRDEALRMMVFDEDTPAVKVMIAGILDMGHNFVAYYMPKNHKEFEQCLIFFRKCEVTDNDMRRIVSNYKWWGKLYELWDDLRDMYYNHQYDQIDRILQTLTIH